MPTETYDVTEITPNENNSFIVVEPEESRPVGGIISEQAPSEVILPDVPVTQVVPVPELTEPQMDAEVDDVPVLEEQTDTTEHVKVIQLEDMLKWGSIIWIVGAAVHFCIVIIQYCIVYRKLMRSGRLHDADSDTVNLYRGVADKLNISRAPRLMICDDPVSPMILGYFKPVVVIPISEVGSKMLDKILTHELVHFRRGDLWIKLLCTLAVSFHWFDPLVHFASRRCCTEMEMSCDEIVLDDADEEAAISYGEAMVEIAKKQVRISSHVLSTSFNPRQSAVKARVVSILDRSPKKRGFAIVLLLIFLSSASGTVFGYNVQANEAVDETKVEVSDMDTDDKTDAEVSTPEEDTDTTSEEEFPLEQGDSEVDADTPETEQPAVEVPEEEHSDDSENTADDGEVTETEPEIENAECTPCEMIYLYRDEPTHNRDGADHYECTVCGKHEAVVIERLQHNMSTGSCTEPSVCVDCGFVGETTDAHDFAPATCTSPSVCRECGDSVGEMLQHDLAPATCTSPSVCRECGGSVGEMLQHDFAPATIEAPKTCRVCGLTEGTVLIPIKLDVSSGLGTYVATGGHKEIGEVRYEYRIDEISYTIGELQPDGKYEVTLYHKGEKVYDNRPYLWFPQDSYGSIPIELIHNRFMFGIQVFNGIYCSFTKSLNSETYPEETKIDMLTTIYLYPGNYTLKSNGGAYCISDPAYGADPVCTELAERNAAKGEPERDTSLIDSVLAMKE